MKNNNSSSNSNSNSNSRNILYMKLLVTCQIMIMFSNI